MFLGKNVLVSGGTGSGKTTLLGLLCGRIPPGQRIIVIEDDLEVDAEKELEERKAYLEEARSQDAAE